METKVYLEKITSNDKVRFYSIEVQGNSIQTSYGLVGTKKPQGGLKPFSSELKARKEFQKVLNRQLKNGYKLIDESEAFNLIDDRIKQVEGKSSKKSLEALRFFQIAQKRSEIDRSDPEVKELVDFVEGL